LLLSRSDCTWAVAYVVLALVPSYPAAALGGSNLLVDGTAAGSLLLVVAAQAICRSWGTGRAQALGLIGLFAGLTGLIAAGSAAVLFYVLTYGGSGAVTAAVGLLGTHAGLTRSVQASAAVLAAACLIALAAGRAGS
jgi:hypothetical protein